jgi:hypothetical protein
LDARTGVTDINGLLICSALVGVYRERSKIEVDLGVCETRVFVRVEIAKVALHITMVNTTHHGVLQAKTHRLPRKYRAFRNSLYHVRILILKIRRKKVIMRGFSNSTGGPRTRRRSHWRSDDIVKRELEDV